MQGRGNCGLCFFLPIGKKAFACFRCGIQHPCPVKIIGHYLKCLDSLFIRKHCHDSCLFGGKCFSDFSADPCNFLFGFIFNLEHFSPFRIEELLCPPRFSPVLSDTHIFKPHFRAVCRFIGRRKYPIHSFIPAPHQAPA